MNDYEVGGGMNAMYGGVNDFAAIPRVVATKNKYKDPYGHTYDQDYLPSNIMYDKRIARGSTYAAMVIPAGTNPEAIMMERKQEERKKKPSKKGNQQTPYIREIYPNRNIPTPEPVPGRVHTDVQTEKFVEQLTDKPPELEQAVATEFYLDRPPVPLFQPKMPSKENCKYTQIFDEDPELFDFDAEIEPMLSVLCSKTLEQARMEVLEEEELRIIKIQQKEYEEIRNAKLIEAQRLEAAELRRKQEFERRKVQQRARKEERKTAHKIFVARVQAKKYLVGLKENSLQTLRDQGLIVQGTERVMHENVMPWMMERMVEFIGGEDYIRSNVEQVVVDSYLLGNKIHRQAIKGEQKRKDDLIQEEKDRIKQKQIFRQERRLKREQRRKNEELQKLRNLIKQSFIDKGEVREHMAQLDLVDINGHFEKSKPFCGTLGGELLQLSLIIQGIQKTFPKHDQSQQQDKKPPAKHLRDLLQNPGLFNFLLNYIRDMKNDNLQILVSQHTLTLLDSFKINLSELSKLTDEQLKQVKDSIISNPGHDIYRMLSDSSINGDFQFYILSDMINDIIDIVSKKIPQDININPQKLEQIIHKIKLVSIPKNVISQDVIKKVEKTNAIGQTYYDTEIVQPKNTNERAIVRLRIPRRKTEEGEERELVEIELEDKALAVPARFDNVPFSIYVFNEAVPKFHRKEMIQFLKKNYADHFESKDPQKECESIIKVADEQAKFIENYFISTYCDEEKMPLFDFDINLNEND